MKLEQLDFRLNFKLTSLFFICILVIGQFQTLDTSHAVAHTQRSCYIKGEQEIYQSNLYICSGNNSGKLIWKLKTKNAKRIPQSIVKSKKPIEGDTCSLTTGSIGDITARDGYTINFKYTKFLVCDSDPNNKSTDVKVWQRNGMLLNENYIVEGEKCSYPQPDVYGYSRDFRNGVLVCSPSNKYDFVQAFNKLTGIPETLRSFDPFVAKEWQAEQLATFKFFKNQNAIGPYRYIPGILSSKSPNSTLDSTKNLLDIEQCKLKQSQPGQYSDWINSGFPYPKERWRPSNVRIQIIPVEFLDLKASATPEQEYGKYLKGVENFFRNTSDTPVNFKFQIPKNYLRINSNSTDFVKQYGFNFGPEVIKLFDSQIDFTDIDIVVIVTTGKTNEQQTHPHHMHLPLKDPIITTEKPIYNYSVQEDKDVGVKDHFLGWIHHFLHMAGLADNFRFPDSKNGFERYSPKWTEEIAFLNLDPTGAVGIQNNKYMGVWGNMSMILLSEPLIWDKWLLGQVYDNQIACVDKNSGGTYWLRPNAIKSNQLKGIVIPTSDQTGIVLESIRSAGYNWRVYPRNQGLLAYTVNTKNNDVEGHPLEVIRKGGLVDKDYLLDAPLKAGEFVVSNGVRVTVIESGDFGDVVKIEKVS
jgi:hypothetical protein